MPAPISTSSCGNRRIKSIGKCPMTPGGIETGIGALSWQIRTALFYLDMVPDPVGQSPGRLQRAARTRSMWLWSGRDISHRGECAWLKPAMQHCFHQAKHPTLLALEAAVVELQRPAVFGDGAYYLLRCAVGDVDFNLQGQPDVGSHHAG